MYNFQTRFFSWTTVSFNQSLFKGRREDLKIEFKGNRLPSQQLLIALQPLLIIHLLEKSICEAAASPFNVKSTSKDLWLILSLLLLPQVTIPQGKSLAMRLCLQPSSVRLTEARSEITSKGKVWRKDEKRRHLVFIRGLQCSIRWQEPLSVVWSNSGNVSAGSRSFHQCFKPPLGFLKFCFENKTKKWTCYEANGWPSLKWWVGGQSRTDHQPDGI